MPVIIEFRWLQVTPAADSVVVQDVRGCHYQLQVRVGYHSTETGLDIWEEWRHVPVGTP